MLALTPLAAAGRADCIAVGVDGGPDVVSSALVLFFGEGVSSVSTKLNEDDDDDSDASLLSLLSLSSSSLEEVDESTTRREAAGIVLRPVVTSLRVAGTVLRAAGTMRARLP